MKKIIKIIFLIVSLVAIIFIILFFEYNKSEKYLKQSFEFINKNDKLIVLNEKKQIIFSYNINDFRVWAKNNWSQLFTKPPSFGDLRLVDPNHFYKFNEGASLSPCFSYLAFSVNDYAAASDISFIFVINLKTNEINIIKDKVLGLVGEMIWSPNSLYLAYTIDTAKTKGDYLRVDNLKVKQPEFIINSNNILNNLKISEPVDYKPNFNNLYWSFDSQYIHFNTDDIESTKIINWEMDIYNKYLYNLID